MIDKDLQDGLMGDKLNNTYKINHSDNNTADSNATGKPEQAESIREADSSDNPVNAKQDTVQENVNINLMELMNSFNKYFEPSNPFGGRRGNYTWWKVNSPVYLNNVLYQHKVRTPLLFNPAVMMAHFKYRHLIIGVYSDRVRKNEYIVGGVPGVYGIDDRPFGDMCRWVQLEGYKPRYGAFGYWLVYIDTKTGKLLKVN